MDKKTRENELEFLFAKVVANNDQDAFKEIFYTYFNSLCYFANQYTNTKQESEDLVQDVFFDIWDKRKNIVINSSLKNYLVSSVRNRCVDFTRKQKTKDKYLSATISQTISLEYNDYPILELRAALQKALEKLPAQSSQIFQLNRFQGLTYTQIAEKLSISVKTVEAHMSRVLKFLQAELRDFLLVILICLLH